MNLSVFHVRLMRAALVALAMLVALLGAAAKHSQFDGPPHHGYLSKAVKMAGARVNPDSGTELGYLVDSPSTEPSFDRNSEPVHTAGAAQHHVYISIFGPPLRV